MHRRLAAVSALLFAAAVHAGPTQLVKDINQTVSASTTGGGGPVAFGGGWLVTLCVNEGGATGYACNPWISDGTPAGTHVLKHISQAAYEAVGGYTVLGPYAYFLQRTSSGTSLWRTDGTESGTQVVAPVNGAGPFVPVLSKTNSLLVFGGQYGPLWRSDGTFAGTFQLTSATVTSFATSADAIYFNASEPAHGNELWTSDGTVQGTHLLKDINPGASGSAPADLAVIGGTLYFWATDTDFAPPMLWASDGTEAGTRQVLDIAPQAHSAFVDFNGKAVFQAQDSTDLGQPIEGVWATDGTQAGTTLLDAQFAYGDIKSVAAAGPYVYYTVGSTVWRSDGTPSGASQVASGAITGYSTDPIFATSGSDIYFTLPNSSPSPLWHGSATSPPAIVSSSVPGAPWGVMGSQVLMNARNTWWGTSNAWSFDGSSVQPLGVARGQPTNGSSCGGTPSVVSMGVLYFIADDGIHGCELWKSDGTAAGTMQVADLVAGVEAGPSGWNSVTVAGGYVYLSVNAGVSGLWRTDGTSAGTVPIGSSIYPQWMAAVGSSLFYATGGDVWRLDAASTTPVKVLSQASIGYSFNNLAGSASDGLFLWAPGNKLVKLDAASSTLSEGAVIPNMAGPGVASALGGVLVFSPWQTTGFQVWRSDGTAAGTYSLAASPGAFSGSLLGSATDRAFFVVNNILYRTDGTAAGTMPITSLLGTPTTVSTDSRALWFVGGVSASDTGVYRLGRLDAGIVKVSTLTDVRQLIGTGSGAIFLANTASTGYELWSSTGGPATLIEDFEPGAPSNNLQLTPAASAVVGANLLMTNAHGGTGWELFSVPLPGAAPAVPTLGHVDFDGDGKADLVVRRGDGTYEVRLMNGTLVQGTSAPITGIAGAPGRVITTTGDFNGDGKADLLFQRDDGATEMWLMNGTTVPQAVQIMPPGAGWSVVHVGDFDGDGKSDIVWHHTNGATSLWLMNGATVAQRGNLMPTGSTWNASHVGDFDGDGRSDIVWRNGDGSVSMWLMNGLSTADRGSLIGASAGAILQAADLDGDGKTDLLWQEGDGSVTFWKMSGRTIAAQQSIMGPNTNWTVSNVADFNGDGKTDLVWLGRDGSIGTWLMNGGTVLEKRTQFAAGSAWTCTVAQDVSGDGKADIIWSNTSGAVGDWLMDGTSNTSRAPLEAAGSTNRIVPLQFHH